MRKELLEFFPKWSESEAYAVTLTMKQYTDGKRLDEIYASQNLRHFRNFISRKYFGSAARRYKTSLNIIPVLETSHSGRLHYHLAIKNPIPNNDDLFRERVKASWSKTLFADKEIDIQRCSDVLGWYKYITKDRSAIIDWENYHIA